MTTKFQYNYYDAFTHKHSGVFPDMYWESQRVALYGCPGITTCLRIYPTDGQGVRGYAGVYIFIHSTSGKEVLEVKTRIHMLGHDEGEQAPSFTVGEGCEVPFGEGNGWTQLFESAEILKEPKISISYSVTVLKITEREGVDETITRPAGEKEYIRYSEDAAVIKRQEEEAAKQEAVRHEGMKDASKEEATEQKVAGKEPTKQQTVEEQAARPEAPKQEAAKGETEKKMAAEGVINQKSASEYRAEVLEIIKHQATRDEAAKQETSRKDGAKQDASKAEEAARAAKEQARRINAGEMLEAYAIKREPDAQPSPPSKRTRSHNDM